ncbi:MAG: leucine-rich repeat domain-containing protein, partial [Oscillospiraceae bacterium]|nr:leucine-rich repeat domain-containing protein [Oscillospiraceae bacterium]
MKKRILSVFTALVMIISLVPVVAIPTEAILSSDEKWEIEVNSTANTANIVGYYGSGGHVIVPSVIDGYKINNIGNRVFQENDTITSVTIESGIVYIEESAFADCTEITEVSIPNTVTRIYSLAFRNCKSLEEITIPESVTNIFINAFNGCTRLLQFIVDENNSDYSSQDGVLFNKDKTTLIQYKTGSPETSYTIPNSVTRIHHQAFNHCSSLTSVTIPNSVTSIGAYAFFECSGLTSVTIPDSVTILEGSVFSRCTSLTTVIIPESVTDLGVSAFINCINLTSISIPSSVTSLRHSLFYNCKNLTEITIPKYVTDISDDVFMNCSELTSVTFECKSPPSFDLGVFDNCTALDTIYVPLGSKADYQAIPMLSGYNFIEYDDGSITNPELTETTTTSVSTTTSTA